jgi:hypothetical protein
MHRRNTPSAPPAEPETPSDTLELMRQLPAHRVRTYIHTVVMPPRDGRLGGMLTGVCQAAIRSGHLSRASMTSILTSLHPLRRTSTKHAYGQVVMQTYNGPNVRSPWITGLVQLGGHF